MSIIKLCYSRNKSSKVITFEKIPLYSLYTNPNVVISVLWIDNLGDISKFICSPSLSSSRFDHAECVVIPPLMPNAALICNMWLKTGLTNKMGQSTCNVLSYLSQRALRLKSYGSLWHPHVFQKPSNAVINPERGVSIHGNSSRNTTCLLPSSDASRNFSNISSRWVTLLFL